MKKFLVAGLGNPGAEYEHTRHNIGFDVLDYMAEKENAIWENGKYVYQTKISYKGRILILIKPQTYMNLSGKAVNYWLQKENIDLENCLVITDDIALPTGKLRIKLKGSDGGHNGLKSIQETLNSQNFPRLRFGVGNDFAQGRQVEYVLGKWKDTEKSVVDESIIKADEAVKMFITSGPGVAMTTFNAKS